MKSRRYLSRLLPAAVLSVGLVLAGCSNAGSDSQSDGDKKVELTIAWWGNPARAEATNAAIALFRKKHPNITVNVRPSAFPGYYDKLNTEFAAGAAPDVFQSDQVMTYGKKGLLLDLGQYKDALDTSKIAPEFLAQGTVDGKLMEIPAGASPMAMVYQPAVFAEAGLQPPGAQTSWQELADLSNKLVRSLAKGTWALADSSAQHNHLQVFLRQRGKDWFTADGKQLGFEKQDLKDWWNYWAALRKSGAVPPADVTVGGVGGDVTKSPVSTKKAAMSIYGTSVSLPRQDWHYGPLPAESATPGVYLMRSVGWAVNAKSKHPREAVQLVDFLLNDVEAGKALGMSRGAPPNSDIAAAIATALDPQDQQIADYVTYLRKPGNSGQAPPPDPAGGRQVRGDLLSRLSQDLLFDKTSVDAAVDSFFTEAATLLSRAA